MKPTSRQVPSKATIVASVLGPSTRRTYKTYQGQFQAYLKSNKASQEPENATSDDCTDFFHHLVAQGKSARTIDQAKSALVCFFRERNVLPNPAREAAARQYVVGLRKFNKLHNFEKEKKAHPLSVPELSTMMNAIGHSHPFLGSMLRLLLCVGFIGCFRISEVLALRWNDVKLVQEEQFKYVSVRLRWHKKAQVSEESQVYNLIDELAFPCMRVCAFYEEYLAMIRRASMNVHGEAIVFPSYTIAKDNVPRLDWTRPLDQNTLGQTMHGVVEKEPSLPIGVSLHSLRRGGAFFRVFESQERRFDFRELMAWCRWTDASTCCEYLLSKSISSGIDPRNLLRLNRVNDKVAIKNDAKSTVGMSVDEICNKLAAVLQGSTLNTRRDAVNQPKKIHKQQTVDHFVLPKAIPTAWCARDAWEQWFVANPANGLPCALKDFTRSMIQADRKKYSERVTLAAAFKRFHSYEQFESSYAGFTSSYAKLLREVRRRKRLNGQISLQDFSCELSLWSLCQISQGNLLPKFSCEECPTGMTNPHKVTNRNHLPHRPPIG